MMSLLLAKPTLLSLALGSSLLLLAGTLLPACGEPKTEAGTASKAVPPYAGDKAPLPTDAELRQRLTPEQYAVVRQNATERPFTGEYFKTKEDGIYVDLVSGKPLFSSRDKFDSDCGWPAFAKPISEEEVKKLSDKSVGMERIEVRSKSGDAHLGHVFNDGPRDRGGLRYCINSAAIRFIPKAKMAEAGYGDYLKFVEGPAPAK